MQKFHKSAITLKNDNQNDSATLPLICQVFVLWELLTPIYFLSWIRFVCFTFNTQKNKTVIRKQIHIHLSFINPKRNIFVDLQVIFFIPLPQKETTEMLEILQERHNTEIWECIFKNSCNSVKMTSNSKHSATVPIIINHIALLCLVRAFDVPAFINFSPFLFISILTHKKLK